MMISTSPPSTLSTNSAALAGDHRVSLVTIAVRASGKRSATSSATRSTPGPQATRLSSSSHSGHSRGGGMTWPQWWQASRWTSRCSTIHAVQFGHWMRWPHVRHKVSGAKPRRLRNSRLCSPLASRSASASTSGGASQRPRSGGSLRMSIAAKSGSVAPPKRAGSWIWRYRPASTIARLSSAGRAGEDHRQPFKMPAHHRDVACVIMDPSSCLKLVRAPRRRR